MSGVVRIARPGKRSLYSHRERGTDVLDRMRAIVDDFQARSGSACEIRVNREHVAFDPPVGDVLVRWIRTALDFIGQLTPPAEVLVSSKRLPSGYIAIEVGDPRIPPATWPPIRVTPGSDSRHAATPLMELSIDGGLTVRILLPPHACSTA